MSARAWSIDLPHGVVLQPLTTHADDRGSFTEVYREAWQLGCKPVQWNVVSSEANVLRGVHVHMRHRDHLVVASGRMLLGLHDLRPWSPTHRHSCLIELSSTGPSQAVMIPEGVAHGFYFSMPTITVYAVSHYWDQTDELACLWSSPELGLPFPVTAPKLSPRDAAAEGYEAFARAFLDGWKAVHGPAPSRS